MANRFTVERPELSAMDILKVKLYARHVNAEVIINQEKRSYLIIRNDRIGYVQKHNGKLFVAYKDGSLSDREYSCYEDIDKIAPIAKAFLQYNIFPEDEFNFEGICNLVHHGNTI
jgi:hypothetical protein